MNGARLRLFALLILSGVITAIASSLFLCVIVTVLTEGPAALLDGLRLGIQMVWWGLVVATLPAILFGSLLWLRGIRRTMVWAATGLLGGFVCLGVAYIGPGDIGTSASFMLRHYPLAFSASFAIAGVLSALVFLALMRLLTRMVRGRPSFRRA